MPGSPLLLWLNANATNPQGTNGTNWTYVASEEDQIVTFASQAPTALGGSKVQYSGMGYGHVYGKPWDDTSDALTGNAWFWASANPWGDPTTRIASNQLPRGARWMTR